jgi:hypothetical protein
MKHEPNEVERAGNTPGFPIGRGNTNFIWLHDARIRNRLHPARPIKDAKNAFNLCLV